jgi:replication factor C large subunit
MIPLCEKYRANCFADIKGQDLAVDTLKIFFKNFPYKKALLLHGPAGTGKTSLAFALAQAEDLEILELNASDLRNRAQLEKIMEPATQQQSLFGKKGKVILVDEIDGISVDRGGLPELLALIEKSSFPIIITANNIWQQKFSLLRRKTEMVKLKEIKYDIIISILQVIIKKENKQVEYDILKTIAAKSRGDIRAALNDLQTVFDTKTLPQHIHEREKEEDIFHVLRKVFKNQSDPNLTRAYDSVDMPIDDIFLWVEENIPYEYKGADLARAYDALSIADVFRGRIYRQQHWRFLVYENFLLSAGISFASKKTRALSEFTIYQRPKRILKIWLQNQKYAKKKTIAAKYAKFVHISKKRAMKEFFLLPLILNKEARKTLKLSEDEIKFLDEYQEKYKSQKA